MTNNSKNYLGTRDAMVKVAKRENNNKRGYLIVNSLQGKHVPVSPNKSLQLFQQLSVQVSEYYSGESILVIGFAETATAIGAAVAIHLGCLYLQTTREDISGMNPLFFQETHSHATEQKLSRDALEQVIPQIDRILFVEDEITTGNTILNAINCIQSLCAHEMQYSVASILNGMNSDRLTHFNDRGIGVHFIYHIDNTSFAEQAQLFQSNGNAYKATITEKADTSVINLCQNYMDPRTLVDGQYYGKSCEKLCLMLEPYFSKMSRNVLVLGTEEFMYPALRVAAYAESTFNLNVRFHATTRSPITVSTHLDYPLHQRYELVSLYDSNRITYLYNLAQYDHVIVITDAAPTRADGILTLLDSLHKQGNQNIHIIRWCNHAN